uniref:C3H1-type domain-containing protein n=1 Tax=Chromera velia CCMP2878 TaxID=1169474 RepID=A0A0G4F4V7_9ALVE|eukprot:Cvel_15085.t1-p1 / transcript=Cvel_15085.t1 / gene=Cvel_15085 / organism=Chromera_velia_CCMP2878 / gene_product=Tristetraprolin, putative / transcript_product=Tristetraprolin, putative / location=Cvel_scaffold1100:33874-40994(-) / protein_length=2077 / sequence_SO=supercontig / SO=protein_coding / is_pseudo=false
MSSTIPLQDELALKFRIPTGSADPGVNARHKTKVCRHWMENRCLLGEKCSFAHGNEDLRESPGRYKAVMCIKYLRGTCIKGTQCRDAHSEDEIRAATQKPRGSRAGNRRKNKGLDRGVSVAAGSGTGSGGSGSGNGHGTNTTADSSGRGRLGGDFLLSSAQSGSGSGNGNCSLEGLSDTAAGHRQPPKGSPLSLPGGRLPLPMAVMSASEASDDPGIGTDRTRMQLMAAGELPGHGHSQLTMQGAVHVPVDLVTLSSHQYQVQRGHPPPLLHQTPQVSTALPSDPTTAMSAMPPQTQPPPPQPQQQKQPEGQAGVCTCKACRAQTGGTAAIPSGIEVAQHGGEVQGLVSRSVPTPPQTTAVVHPLHQHPKVSSLAGNEPGGPLPDQPSAQPLLLERNPPTAHYHGEAVDRQMQQQQHHGSCTCPFHSSDMGQQGHIHHGPAVKQSQMLTVAPQHAVVLDQAPPPPPHPPGRQLLPLRVFVGNEPAGPSYPGHHGICTEERPAPLGSGTPSSKSRGLSVTHHVHHLQLIDPNTHVSPPLAHEGNPVSGGVGAEGRVATLWRSHQDSSGSLSGIPLAQPQQQVPAVPQPLPLEGQQSNATEVHRPSSICPSHTHHSPHLQPHPASASISHGARGRRVHSHAPVQQAAKPATATICSCDCGRCHPGGGGDAWKDRQSSAASIAYSATGSPGGSAAASAVVQFDPDSAALAAAEKERERACKVGSVVSVSVVNVAGQTPIISAAEATETVTVEAGQARLAAMEHRDRLERERQARDMEKERERESGGGQHPRPASASLVFSGSAAGGTILFRRACQCAACTASGLIAVAAESLPPELRDLQIQHHSSPSPTPESLGASHHSNEHSEGGGQGHRGGGDHHAIPPVSRGGSGVSPTTSHATGLQAVSRGPPMHHDGTQPAPRQQQQPQLVHPPPPLLPSSHPMHPHPSQAQHVPLPPEGVETHMGAYQRTTEGSLVGDEVAAKQSVPSHQRPHTGGELLVRHQQQQMHQQHHAQGGGWSSSVAAHSQPGQVSQPPPAPHHCPPPHQSAQQQSEPSSFLPPLSPPSGAAPGPSLPLPLQGPDQHHQLQQAAAGQAVQHGCPVHVHVHSHSHSHVSGVQHWQADRSAPHSSLESPQTLPQTSGGPQRFPVQQQQQQQVCLPPHSRQEHQQSEQRQEPRHHTHPSLQAAHSSVPHSSLHAPPHLQNQHQHVTSPDVSSSSPRLHSLPPPTHQSYSSNFPVRVHLAASGFPHDPNQHFTHIPPPPAGPPPGPPVAASPYVPPSQHQQPGGTSSVQYGQSAQQQQAGREQQTWQQQQMQQEDGGAEKSRGHHHSQPPPPPPPPKPQPQQLQQMDTERQGGTGAVYAQSHQPRQQQPPPPGGAPHVMAMAGGHGQRSSQGNAANAPGKFSADGGAGVGSSSGGASWAQTGGHGGAGLHSSSHRDHPQSQRAATDHLQQQQQQQQSSQQHYPQQHYLPLQQQQQMHHHPHGGDDREHAGGGGGGGGRVSSSQLGPPGPPTSSFPSPHFHGGQAHSSSVARCPSSGGLQHEHSSLPSRPSGLEPFEGMERWRGRGERVRGQADSSSSLMHQQTLPRPHGGSDSAACLVGPPMSSRSFSYSQHMQQVAASGSEAQSAAQATAQLGGDSDTVYVGDIASSHNARGRGGVEQDGGDRDAERQSGGDRVTVGGGSGGGGSQEGSGGSGDRDTLSGSSANFHQRSTHHHHKHHNSSRGTGTRCISSSEGRAGGGSGGGSGEDSRHRRPQSPRAALMQMQTGGVKLDQQAAGQQAGSSSAEFLLDRESEGYMDCDRDGVSDKRTASIDLHASSSGGVDRRLSLSGDSAGRSAPTFLCAHSGGGRVNAGDGDGDNDTLGNDNEKEVSSVSQNCGSCSDYALGDTSNDDATGAGGGPPRGWWVDDQVLSSHNQKLLRGATTEADEDEDREYGGSSRLLGLRQRSFSFFDEDDEADPLASPPTGRQSRSRFLPVSVGGKGGPFGTSLLNDVSGGPGVLSGLGGRQMEPVMGGENRSSVTAAVDRFAAGGTAADDIVGGGDGVVGGIGMEGTGPVGEGESASHKAEAMRESLRECLDGWGH